MPDAAASRKRQIVDDLKSSRPVFGLPYLPAVVPQWSGPPRLDINAFWRTLRFPPCVQRSRAQKTGLVDI
jgi:hypothetical protein